MLGTLEPVLLGGVIVFLISLAGAYIEFNNRLVAVVDAVLFVVVFGLSPILLTLVLSDVHARSSAGSRPG